MPCPAALTRAPRIAQSSFEALATTTILVYNRSKTTSNAREGKIVIMAITVGAFDSAKYPGGKLKGGAAMLRTIGCCYSNNCMDNCSQTMTEVGFRERRKG